MKLPKLFVTLGVLGTLLVSACGSNQAADSADGSSGQALKIGVVNYVSHPALDAVEAGFIEGLAEAGYTDGAKVTIEVQNAQADQATLTAIANQFAQDKKDLVLAIATPSGQAVAQVIVDKPVLFAAVTDPVAAELVESWEKPGSNITGASDMNPVADQLSLITEIDPSVKKIGIVYASGEVNSEVQVTAAEEAAAKLGLSVEKAAVSNSSEVQQAAQSLKVDAFYVPTDNVVVSGVEALIQVAEQQQALVVASDEGSVERGAAASLTVNYAQQGKDVAKMAVEILEGADPAEMPVQTQKTFDLTVNPEAAKRMGAELPADMVSRAAKTY